jgi:hypothetical protein
MNLLLDTPALIWFLENDPCVFYRGRTTIVTHSVVIAH